VDSVLEAITGNFWFQVAILLGVATASNFLFVRLKVPKIVGLIVVGVALGPSVSGFINIDQSGGDDLLSLLAGFGAIIMLFMIGLEFNIRDIYTGKNMMIALGGIVLPWLGGFLLAEILLPDSGLGASRLAQSVFVGTALVATSVAITAGVLREMGLLSSSIAKTVLGVAVVDDVLGMIVLAISAGIASEGGLDVENLFWISVAAVLFVTVGAYVGIKFFTKFIGAVERRGISHGLVESGFMLALAFAFLYAFVSEYIGISKIVGAFIAGTSFSACEYRKQFKQGITFLEWAFAPIFFISLGVLVDIRLPLEIWFFALALAAVAILSKVIGGGIPARLLGMTSRESMAVGLGMSPRLEVAMIIALFGLTEGIIDSRIYSVIIIMGLITVIVAPYLLRRTAAKIPRGPPGSPEDTVCELNPG
jgi:Kef-type K+ transport system membrane component KefB